MDQDVVQGTECKLCAGGGSGTWIEPGVHGFVLSGGHRLLLEGCAEGAAIGSADVCGILLHSLDHEACLGCSY